MSQSQQDLQMLKKNLETEDIRAFHFKLFLKRLERLNITNQKSVIFILLLNSKTHSPRDSLNLEKQPSEKSCLIKNRGCAGEQESQESQQDTVPVHLKPAPGDWPPRGCQAVMFKLVLWHYWQS